MMMMISMSANVIIIIIVIIIIVIIRMKMGVIRQTGVKVALVSWDPLTMTNSHKKGESRNLDPKYYHRPHQHQDHHWYHFQTHGTPSQ